MTEICLSIGCVVFILFLCFLCLFDFDHSNQYRKNKSLKLEHWHAMICKVLLERWPFAVPQISCTSIYQPRAFMYRCHRDHVPPCAAICRQCDIRGVTVISVGSQWSRSGVAVGSQWGRLAV